MPHRSRRVIAVSLGALALAARAATAQSTGLVVGTVTDATRHTPIAGADVRIGDTRLGARTDSTGRYRIAGIPRGRHPMLVRRLGYQGDSTDVDVGSDSAVVDVALTVAVRELETTRVEEKRTPTTFEVPNVPTRLQEFEQRRLARRGGYFVTGDVLQKNYDRKLGDVLSFGIPGIRILRAPDGTQYAASGRTAMKLRAGVSTQCVPKLFLDGAQLGDSTLTNFAPGELGGVEYHDGGTIPVQYRRPGTECGVLLLWSR